MSAPPPLVAAQATRWLHGPAVDLLLGCGLGYVLTIPLLLLLTEVTGIGFWSTGVTLAITLLVAGPHYGATLQRVYGRREDRRRYAFFAVHLTGFLLLVFVAAQYDAALRTLMVTIYLTWSPWHFSGQNYGLALMFLRRRDLDPSPRAKRALYASFILSFLLSVLALHVQGPAWSFGGVEVFRLGIPQNLAVALAAVVGTLYVLSLGLVAVPLLRRGTLSDLVPMATLVLAQAFWFTLPGLILVMSGRPAASLAFGAVWISAAHSIQYLWVTSYYEKRTNAAMRLAPYLVKVLLAGTLLAVLPGLLFAPGRLGPLPWASGLGGLIFAMLNLHHFVLDGAVWKLRDGRVARALLRTDDSQQPEPAAPRRRWLRSAIAAAGATCLLVPIFHYREVRVYQRTVAVDVQRALQSIERIRWMGRDSVELRVHVAEALARDDDPWRAIEEYRRSIALRPTAAAWNGLAVQLDRKGDVPGAAEARIQARKIEPKPARPAESRSSRPHL